MAIDRIGFYDAEEVREFLTPGGAADLSGSFQAVSTTLAGLDAIPGTAGLIEQTGPDTFTIRLIGVANATDILTRAGGDARYASSGSGVLSFNTRTGAVTLTSGDVTTALTYTPTSVTGLTGSQSVAAFKTGLSLVKGDVGLGSVDNTADATKAVLSATKLATGRTISITGKATSAGGTFDGSGNLALNITAVTLVAGDIPNIAESQVTNLTSDLALKAPLASPVFTGLIGSSGGIQITGYTAPSVGSGLELNFQASEGIVQAYNRTGAAWLTLALRGAQIDIRPNGTTVASFTSTGVAITGVVAATGAVSGSNLSGTNTGDTVLTTVEIDLGTLPRCSGSFTITGAGMTTGKPVMIVQAVGPYTGKGTLADEAEMDSLSIAASVTSATVITAYWSSSNRVTGNVKFNYFIGA